MIFFIIFLPAFEAPKNLFLLLFISVGILNNISSMNFLKFWNKWDYLFFTIIVTSLLSTIFTNFSGHAEWRGFRSSLWIILYIWLLTKYKYTQKELSFIFYATIFSCIPVLFWALFNYYSHGMKIQLNSVGHVNHSAIYLTIIFGAASGLFISLFKSKLNTKIFTAAGVCLFFLISIIQTESRAAVLCGLTLIPILCLLPFYQSKTKNRITAFFFVSLIIILFFTITKPNVLEKQIELQKKNNVSHDRTMVWNVGIEAAKNNIFFGIGLTNWGELKEKDIRDLVLAREEVYNEKNYLYLSHGHSLYLTSFVEKGIFGFFATILFMATWIYELFISFKEINSEKQGIYLWVACLGAWLAIFEIGFFNTTFHHENALLAMTYLGIYLSYINNKKFLKK